MERESEGKHGPLVEAGTGSKWGQVSGGDFNFTECLAVAKKEGESAQTE